LKINTHLAENEGGMICHPTDPTDRSDRSDYSTWQSRAGLFASGAAVAAVV